MFHKLSSLFIFAALFSFLVCSCSKEEDVPGTSGPLVGSIAPDFNLSDLSGNPVKLSDYTHKTIVLFFFGHSCPSCKGVAPIIQTELQEVYGAREDFILLGIDQWNGNVSAVESFQKSTGISFRLLLKGGSVASEYKSSYDRLVLIEKSGKILFNGTRGAKTDFPDLLYYVKKDLGI